MRHGLAGGVEHPQVGEVGAHHALVHGRRQLDLKQRLRAAGLERDAEGEVGRVPRQPPTARQAGSNPQARTISFTPDSFLRWYRRQVANDQHQHADAKE
jgi:hypothetical protein